MIRIFNPFTILTAAVFTLLSCSAENPQSDFLNGQSCPEDILTVTATISPDDDTKVTYSENQNSALRPLWTKGDYLIACDASGNTYGYQVDKLDTNNDAELKLVTEGEHKGSCINDPENGTIMFFAYAPGKTPSDIASGAVTMDFSVQKQQDGMPAVMTASDTVKDNNLSLKFKNKCAVIGIKDIVIPDAKNKTITRFTLSSHEIVSEASLNLKKSEFEGKTPSKFITAETTITGDADGKFSGSYFISMIPCTTHKDYPLILTATDSEGNTYSRALNTADKSWSPGKYYYIHENASHKLTKNTLPTVALTQGSVQWADRNLGAASLYDAGTYYMWGSVDKIYSAISGTSVTTATGFNYKNAPYSEGGNDDKKYTKYNNTDGKVVLDPVDDIVQLTYPGSGWQIPGQADCESIKNLSWSWDGNNFCKYSGNLYIRAAGYTGDKSLGQLNSNLYLWTSTRGSDSDISYMFTSDDFVSPQCGTGKRHYGYPIRPVRK